MQAHDHANSSSARCLRCLRWARQQVIVQLVPTRAVQHPHHTQIMNFMMHAEPPHFLTLILILRARCL